MKTVFKITAGLLSEVLRQLRQPHDTAHERVGFISCQISKSSPKTLVILAQEYHSVLDSHYADDPLVGACINKEAIRSALQVALSNKCSMFHVHVHSHHGVPQFSHTDNESNRRLFPDFFNVAGEKPHGAIVFSSDKARGLVWISKESDTKQIDEFVVVGTPLSVWWPENHPNRGASARDFSRQDFLGAESNKILSRVKIGIVGLGGGGSHVAQQLAHIGISRYVICDPDKIENSNLNRLVGASINDEKAKRYKTFIAGRVIKGLIKNPEIDTHKKWQTGLLSLVECHAILGCVDSLGDREQLEKFCRGNLIPYIDIGMNVSKSGQSSLVSGQVAISTPDMPCLKCMLILKDKDIANEETRYGVAGIRPQVVWSNGVLASSAVGILMSLICPWGQNHFSDSTFRVYNGNEHTLEASPRCPYLPKKCRHYSLKDIGWPLFKLSNIKT